jgi:hypothetical protein
MPPLLLMKVITSHRKKLAKLTTTMAKSIGLNFNDVKRFLPLFEKKVLASRPLNVYQF